MLTKFAAALLAIILSAGSVHAMARARSHSLSFAHFPTCTEGLVKAICVCRAADGSRRFGQGDIATPSMVRARTASGGDAGAPDFSLDHREREKKLEDP